MSEIPVGTQMPAPIAMAVIRVNPDKTDTRYTELKLQIDGILAFAKTRAVNSDQDVIDATNDLGLISLLKKATEEKRQEYVKPINDHVNAVNKAFHALTDPIEEADKLTRNKIQAYRALVESRRRMAEAINKQKEEIARKEAELSGTGEITSDITPVVVPMAPPAHVQAGTATLGTSKVRKWELVNFAQVPDDMKTLDTVKIGKLVRAGIDSIAGIRIWEEDGIRVTTR